MSLNFESILIVTYGRSGSTLLQGLLNSIDGVLVRGENENFIIGLYESYERLCLAKKHLKSIKPSHSWYGVHLIDIGLFIQHCTAIIEDAILADQKYNNDIKAYGFKEVRYYEAEKFDKYLDFLDKVFPNVCFIFNTRNKNDVSNSSWWKNRSKDSVVKLLEDTENKFKNYAKNHPNNCFLIKYEDVINKTENLKSMFEFIGAGYVDRDIDKIINLPHGDPTQVIIDKVKFESGRKITYLKSKYHKIIKFLVFDKFFENTNNNKSISFQGVIIPISDSIFIKSIRVVTSFGENNGVCGLNSEHYGKKYPEISSASMARFWLDNVFFGADKTAKVVIEAIIECQIKSVHIATIEIE